MSEQEFAEFERIVANVIRNSAEVRQAICACQCPNLVVEH